MQSLFVFHKMELSSFSQKYKNVSREKLIANFNLCKIIFYHANYIYFVIK